MKIEISKRARNRAERIDQRWRLEADYPNLFADELHTAFLRLASSPHIGVPFPTEQRPHLKRLLLEKTRYHLYFEVDDRMSVVRLLTIWGATRGRTPKL